MSAREAGDGIYLDDTFTVKLNSDDAFKKLFVYVRRLFFMGCAGSIPSELGGLSALETLDLYNNRLDGESIGDDAWSGTEDFEIV